MQNAKKSDTQDPCLHPKAWRQRSPDPPLHLACKSGNKAMVNYLLNKQVLSKELKLSPPTPLHKAAESGNFDIVEVLLKNYTSEELFEVLSMKTSKNNKELSPLHIACRRGHYKIVNLLFDNIEETQKKKIANSLGRKNRTPLHYSCQSESIMITKLLLEKFKATIQKDDDGAFPIHVAAQYGHCCIVDYILKEDQTIINETDRHFNTALNIATRYDKTEMMRTLLDM